LEKVSQQYPNLSFGLKYDESGMAFMGVAKAEKGKLIKDECIDY